MNNKPILITVPKYVTLTPATTLAPSTIKDYSGSISSSSENSMDEFILRGKKRRLDHLTWEEKLQRKKLKNRVAAQTSRDRKKAKMDDMEYTIKNLTDENTILRTRCNDLTTENRDLTKRTGDLERQVQNLTKRFDEQHKEFLKLSTVNNNNNNNTTTTNNIIHHDNDNNNNNNVDECTINNLKNGSAEGIIDTTISIRNCQSNRTEQREYQEKQQKGNNDCRPVEDNCIMPTLQDLLEDIEETRLEELAEFLFTDVTQHMENDTARCRKSIFTKDESSTKRQSKSLVGTTTEYMESTGKDISGNLNTPQKTRQAIEKAQNNFIEDADETLIIEEQLLIKASSTVPTHHDSLNNNNNNINNENCNNMSKKKNVMEEDTLYGTYDETTNCITIVLSNEGQISMDDVHNDLVNEIIEDQSGIIEASQQKCNAIDSSISSSSSSSSSSISTQPTTSISTTCKENTINVASSIPSDVCSNILQNIYDIDLKSPISPIKSITNESGYGSIGSPTSSIFSNDYPFSDIFPQLNKLKQISPMHKTHTTTTTSSSSSSSSSSFNDVPYYYNSVNDDDLLMEFDTFWNESYSSDLFPSLN